MTVFIIYLHLVIYFFSFYPHTVLNLLRDLAALHHFLLQWEFNCCYYVGTVKVGNIFPKWNVGLFYESGIILKTFVGHSPHAGFSDGEEKEIIQDWFLP